MSKFIVSAALTGAIHTPSMSPYLPITPDEIDADVRRASEAGAVVVHVHARDPKTGQPSANSALFGEILSKIKSSCFKALREFSQFFGEENTKPEFEIYEPN